MGFPRQEYWCRLPFPSPGDPPDSGIGSVFPALAGRFFTTGPPHQGSCTWTYPRNKKWVERNQQMVSPESSVVLPLPQEVLFPTTSHWSHNQKRVSYSSWGICQHFTFFEECLLSLSFSTLAPVTRKNILFKLHNLKNALLIKIFVCVITIIITNYTQPDELNITFQPSRTQNSWTIKSW